MITHLSGVSVDCFPANLLRCVLLVCCACLPRALAAEPLPAIPPAEVAGNALTTKASMPPDLDSNDVESTVFDLYLADRFSGYMLVRYTDDWCEVDDAQDAASQFKEVKEPTKIENLLAPRIYGVREEKDVGSVRCDLRNFRLVITVDPALLSTKSADLLSRLPDPENHFSLQQSASVASTGGRAEKSQSALTHRTIASYGAFLGVLDATAVQNSDYIVTEASAGGIVGEYQTAAGLIQTKGQPFASTVEIAGASIETSQDIFRDRDVLSGSRFEVFIPSRARVQFFREDRLLAVQVLDFGLQQVDTTYFPDGSYDVDIVILEDNGRESREKRYFTKSGYLAIDSRPVFFAQAGVLRDRLNLLDVPVYDTGLRWRAVKSAEIKGSVYGTNRVQIGSLETLALFHSFVMGAGASLSSHHDTGVSGNLGGALGGVNFSLSGTQTLKGGSEPVPIDLEVAPEIRNRQLLDQKEQLVSPKRSSVSATVSKSIGAVSIAYTINRNRRPLALLIQPTAGDPDSNDTGPRIETENRFAHGPRLSWRILQSERSVLRLDASLLDTDRGRDLALGLSFRYQFEKGLSTDSSLTRNEDAEHGDTTLRNAVTYDNKQRTGDGLRLAYTNDVRDQDKPNKSRFLTNQLSLDNTNRLLQTSGFVRDVRQSANDESGASAGQSAGINAASSVIYSHEAGFALSPPLREGAVFIADLESTKPTSPFEIVINGQVYATITGGKRTALGLAPFKTYSILLRPTNESDLVNVDDNVYEVTLFPGNVAKKTWHIEKVIIAIGRLVDKAGSPITNRRIRGTRDYTATEADGTFQMELGGIEKLSVDSKDLKCSLSIAVPEDVKFVLDVGDVICH